MAIFFLVVLVTGLLATVGPAPMAASVVEMSTRVTSKTSNMGLPWLTPETIQSPVLSISEVPAQAETEIEIISNVATEAHEVDTIASSVSPVVSEDSNFASIEESVPENAHAHTEQVDDEIVAAPESPAEQRFDDEDAADEATQPEAPEMVVPSDLPADFEVTESTSVKSVQAEQAEGQIFEQSDKVEIKMEAPVAPEDVDIGVASVLVDPEVVEIEEASVPVAPEDFEIKVTSSPTEEADSSAAPNPPSIEQVEKSAPQSFMSESSSVCSLVDEDGEGNDESMASSPSHVGDLHQSLPYPVLSEQQEACKA